MRYRIHYISIHQAEEIGIKGDVDRETIGAVGVEIERSRSVEFFAFQVHDRNGNLHAIRCRSVQLLDLVAGRVISAGDLLALEQRRIARSYIVLVDRLRRNE